MAMRDIVSRYVLKARDQTGSAISRANKAVASAERQVLKYAGAIGAVVGPAALGLLTKRSLENIDALAKKSDQLGINITKLQAYHFAGEQAGVSTTAFDEALVKANKRLGEASHGMGAAVKWIEKLNLNTEELKTLSPDQLFERYADSIRGLSSRGEQMAAISALMGDESRSLLNLIDQGPGIIEKYQQDLESIGVALDRVDAAKVEQANDAMDRAGRVAEGVGNTIAVKLAPILTAVSDLMFESAAEAGGFGDTIQGAIDKAIRVVGVFADGLQGLKIIWEGLKVATSGAALVILETLRQILDGWDKILGGINAGLNRVIDGINAISGLSIPRLDTSPLGGSVEAIDGLMDSVQDNISGGLQRMHDLANEDLPSDKMRKFFDDAIAASEEAAQKVAADRERMAGQDDPEAEAKRTAAQEKALQQAQKQLEQVEQFLESETQSLNRALDNRSAMVNAAFEQGLINEARRKEIMEQLEQQHQEKINGIIQNSLSAREKFQQASFGVQVSTVAGALQDMTAGVATSSKTMFKLNKIAGIAMATVNTAAGVTQALAFYPPPLSFIMAAAQLAAGVAQINSIKSTSFGGGTTPSVAGSTPTFNGQPVGNNGQGPAPSLRGGEGVGGAPKTKRIEIPDPGGRLMTGSQVRQLIEEIGMEADDMGLQVVVVREARTG